MKNKVKKSDVKTYDINISEKSLTYLARVVIDHKLKANDTLTVNFLNAKIIVHVTLKENAL